MSGATTVISSRIFYLIFIRLKRGSDYMNTKNMCAVYFKHCNAYDLRSSLFTQAKVLCLFFE